jgi:UDP-glucose 4-epimerase
VSTYILKDAEDYSTRTLYVAVCRELGKTPRFLPVPAWMVRLGGALSEDLRKVTGSFRVSSDKIREELGYSPPYPLEQGIAETVEWYRRSGR